MLTAYDSTGKEYGVSIHREAKEIPWERLSDEAKRCFWKEYEPGPTTITCDTGDSLTFTPPDILILHTKDGDVRLYHEPPQRI